MPRMSQAEVDAHNARLAAQSAVQQGLPLAVDPNIKLESEIHEQIIQYLNLKEYPFFRQRMDKKTRGPKGYPDFAYVVNGKACFLEVKMPGEDLDEDQVEWQIKLVTAGAHHRVVHSLAEAVEAVHEAESP